MQLMVGQLWKSLARSHTGAIELVIRIIHLIATEHSFQATLVERLVMGHQRKSFDQWLNLCPHLREHRGVFCILSSQTMHLRTPIIIVVRLRLNQGIERIHYLAIAYNPTPTEQTLVRSLLAVSKSIAAKSLIVASHSVRCCFGLRH